MNVFLIKLTSLPILVIIGIYERHLAAGQRFRESGVCVANSFFNSLPRQIKNIPLVEALVGSSSDDMYEAIFDVDAGSDMDLFGDSEDEFASALRSLPSRDYLEAPSTPTVKMRNRRPSSTRPRGSPRGSPRIPISLDPAPEVPASGSNRSPLAVLFGSRLPSTSDAQAAALRAEASVRRVESLLEDIRDLPVQELKEEMKELQVRDINISYVLLGEQNRSIRIVKPVLKIFYLFSRRI